MIKDYLKKLEGENMPRKPREKLQDGIYHIIVRSISDVNLFRSNDDKEKYLKFIKKYQDIFLFKVYAYCVMNTHAHLMIDCCGADISRIMHSINQCYAMYFNKKYERHGHVFQDRFKSILVKNEAYLLNLSAYIHNNVKDIKQFKDKKEAYRYSSLGIYLGYFEDDKKILDIKYVLEHFSRDVIRARVLYKSFLSIREDSNVEEEPKVSIERDEYKSERTILIRNVKPEDVVRFIEETIGKSTNSSKKFNRDDLEFKAVCIITMRMLCGFNYRQICDALGNVTIANVSELCQRGLKLIRKEIKYRALIPDLVKRHATTLKTS
jgi:REP element-mobilizing transposase RayT